ncbi:hypothetical protein HJG60_009683 [Phyllostomus discolor]|uniref:Uncharacterized protein n=1 Tax=Phyllostomus discolor TaxID=89673 RepID=A0A834B2C1_9CHIR|nr:hypothetical protein HJG60_009683 [Phyllostomus discolor]
MTRPHSCVIYTLAGGGTHTFGRGRVLVPELKQGHVTEHDGTLLAGRGAGKTCQRGGFRAVSWPEVSGENTQKQAEQEDQDDGQRGGGWVAGQEEGLREEERHRGHLTEGLVGQGSVGATAG